MAWTTTDLLSSVKLKAMSPSNQATITDANILTIATEEMLGWIVPTVLATGSGHFTYAKDITTVADQASYEIPYRSIGNKLANVTLVTSDSQEVKVPIVDYQELDARDQSSSTVSYVVAFVRGHRLHLSPIPDAGLTLRLIFHMRPSELVAESACTTLSSTFTASSVDVASTSFLTVAGNIDLVSQHEPYPIIGYDIPAVVFDSNTLTTIGFPASDAQENDYVCLAGESPVPQIPYELRGVLVERTVARVLGILGDASGMQMALDRAARVEDTALKLVTPRVDQQAQRIVNTNGPRAVWNRARFPWVY